MNTNTPTDDKARDEAKEDPCESAYQVARELWKQNTGDAVIPDRDSFEDGYDAGYLVAKSEMSKSVSMEDAFVALQKQRYDEAIGVINVPNRADFEAGWNAHAAALSHGVDEKDDQLARADGDELQHTVTIYQHGELVYMVYVTPHHAEKFADAINAAIIDAYSRRAK